jgi:hypothetical protein
VVSPLLVRFALSSNEQTVVAFNDVRLAAGLCTENLDRVLDHDSDIETVAGDGNGHLVIIAKQHLTRVGRVFYVWGLPVWRSDWPAIKPAAIDRYRFN